jgi:protein subunit release factor B
VKDKEQRRKERENNDDDDRKSKISAGSQARSIASEKSQSTKKIT